MVSDAAIPSNEINNSFNFEQFLFVKVADVVWIIEIKRTSALRYVNRSKKCILFENCSSVCLLSKIYCHVLTKKKTEIKLPLQNSSRVTITSRYTAYIKKIESWTYVEMNNISLKLLQGMCEGVILTSSGQDSWTFLSSSAEGSCCFSFVWGKSTRLSGSWGISGKLLRNAAAAQ